MADRKQLLLTPGPLTTSDATRNAMLQDWGRANRRLLVSVIGAVAGPVLCGWVIGLTSPSALFSFITAVFLLLCAFGIWRHTRPPPVPLEERAPFLPMSRVGSCAGELDLNGTDETP